MIKKSARRTRRTHSPVFKGRVAFAALRDDTTMAELCGEFELHASQVIESKRKLLEGAAEVFGGAQHAAPPVHLVSLHARIGQLAPEQYMALAAGTETDVDNLSIAPAARALGKPLFIVARQRQRRNAMVFDAATANLAMPRGYVLTVEVLRVIRAP